MFLWIMAAGLVGLLLMALPGLSHHGGMGAHGIGHAGHAGHIGPVHAGDHAGIGHTPHTAVTTSGHAPAIPNAHGHAAHAETANNGPDISALRFLPSPRMIFSLVALFGAFGYAAQAGLHLAPVLAALSAILPAILVERYAVSPWWNRMLSYQGEPTAPLESLTMHEAEAVTPFRNGRGVICAVHDGRMIQLSATLRDEQTSAPIRVGDKLRIEEIDPANERAVVSIH